MNNNNMQSITIPGASNFKFSAVRPDDLGATEYTLVTIAVDISASVYGFNAELKSAVLAVLDASRKSPRADNLLVRLLTFNTETVEIFGFKSISDIQSLDINDFVPNGMTSLFDATMDAVAATEQYANVLYQQDFDTNAAVYIISDGGDNQSRLATERNIADKVQEIRRNEQLESIVTMLIGINTDNGQVKKLLENYAKDAEFSQYVDVKDASAQSLAKLAGFVSKSISSQSQALGSGAASQSLSF